MGVFEERYQHQVECANRMRSKYPELFKEQGPNHPIGVDAGWWPLLEEVCEFLDAKRKQGIDVYFVQIKEKFAALTIYLGGNFSTDAAQCIHAKIDEIYARSQKTCEKCGSIENVVISAAGGWWLKAYCPTCHEARGGRKGQIKEAKEVLEELRKNIVYSNDKTIVE